MSDWESICADAQYEAEQEKLRIEYFPDDDEIEDRYYDIAAGREWNKITSIYNIQNYYGKINEWDSLGESSKLSYCKELLKPVEPDSFKLQRQVFVLSNLINLDILKCPLYLIMEAANFNEIDTEHITLKINCLIPKQHYIAHIHMLYTQMQIKSLQIPLENSTEFLQELFTIWYMFKNDMSPYKISKELIPYDSLAYEPKQIERKLKAIRLLIK